MNKKDKWILLGLVTLLILLLAVCAAIYHLKQNQSAFVPPEFDKNAISGIPEIPSGMDYRILDIKEGYRVSMCVNPTLTGDLLPLNFTADAGNTLWVSAMVLSESGEVLGRTGLLRPGEYVANIRLDPVPKHDGSVIIKILSYEPETYYSLGAANAQIQIKTE